MIGAAPRIEALDVEETEFFVGDRRANDISSGIGVAPVDARL